MADVDKKSRPRIINKIKAWWVIIPGLDFSSTSAMGHFLKTKPFERGYL